MDHSLTIVDQNTLIVKDKYELKRTESKIEHIISMDQAVGEYFVETYDDKSIQSMIELSSDGSFEQVYFYIETGEKIFKEGCYEIFVPSGLIYFNYEEGQDDNFHAILDAPNEILYSPYGDFKKV